MEFPPRSPNPCWSLLRAAPEREEDRGLSPRTHARDNPTSEEMRVNEGLEQALERAAEAVRASEAVVVAAGAGMGVDSGLPDFRGPEGFWRAYPAYERLGLRFEQMANPTWFTKDPALAWGFYGHRLRLYRATRPHAGFHHLREWMDACPHGGFVFTSNVDGQFQQAGFAENRVLECHGSIHWMQCLQRCSQPLWEDGSSTVEIDEATMRARPPLPSCPGCGRLARPNILMFGDWGWDPGRTTTQEAAWRRWRRGLPHDARVVVIECGAGLAIPSVRAFSESEVDAGATLIRINVRDSEVPDGQIGLPLPALEALQQIRARLS